MANVRFGAWNAEETKKDKCETEKKETRGGGRGSQCKWRIKGRKTKDSKDEKTVRAKKVSNPVYVPTFPSGIDFQLLCGYTQRILTNFNKDYR